MSFMTISGAIATRAQTGRSAALASLFRRRSTSLADKRRSAVYRHLNAGAMYSPGGGRRYPTAPPAGTATGILPPTAEPSCCYRRRMRRASVTAPLACHSLDGAACLLILLPWPTIGPPLDRTTFHCFASVSLAQAHIDCSYHLDMTWWPAPPHSSTSSHVLPATMPSCFHAICNSQPCLGFLTCISA